MCKNVMPVGTAEYGPSSLGRRSFDDLKEAHPAHQGNQTGACLWVAKFQVDHTMLEEQFRIDDFEPSFYNMRPVTHMDFPEPSTTCRNISEYHRQTFQIERFKWFNKNIICSKQHQADVRHSKHRHSTFFSNLPACVLRAMDSP
nr:uncharacterized protein LOC109429928 [Aedes albopictus]